ncbi:hypothetical protein BXZ70DRAFT_205355 [Cristinia sonorae]|uniref:XLF-like N-terminal domain-containing protein n=1 Tax=Cristinia sonorae TaxID=1940300 RepID=A0A8K0XPG6_9AGAR|nr:hypothetical protein BXZ70DRAFT_205355 [Cristinia sonorae]
MEYLTEDHLKKLLNQEWLVKIDSDKSTPYLFKFHASTEEASCCLMITDTKNVWGEVLSGNAFARRWRDCNPSQLTIATDSDKQAEWRKQLLELLVNAHSMGGIADLSFDIVPSPNADIAFELGSDEFKWRWETYTLGPKVSAGVLSQQLIMPLISVSHLAFSSSDPVSELSDANLQMAIDKAGRTGRRAVDTHVKHAISRPRLTTTLRRMSAVFNFLPELPPVVSKTDVPDLKIPELPGNESLPPQLIPVNPVDEIHRGFPDEAKNKALKEVDDSQHGVENQGSGDSDSATEEEDDEPPVVNSKASEKGKDRDDMESNPEPMVTSSVPPTADPYRSREPSPKVTRTSTPADTDSQASSSRPPKKLKRKPAPSSSDDDSDDEPKRPAVIVKRTAQRGAKQPLKRGGKRF